MTIIRLLQRSHLDAQANVSTTEEAPRQSARLQVQNAVQGWAQRSQETHVQGSAQAHRLKLPPLNTQVCARTRATAWSTDQHGTSPSSMRRANRLRSSAGFAAVRREGKSWSDRRLVLIARPNCSSAPRFGFSVSRRLGNAVKRNKIRRRLKAAAAGAGVVGGWDLVVIARRGAQLADYSELERSLGRLLGRAKVVSTGSQHRSSVGRGTR